MNIQSPRFVKWKPRSSDRLGLALRETFHPHHNAVPEQLTHLIERLQHRPGARER